MVTCFVILYNIHTSLSQVAAADRTGQGSHGGILVVGYEEWQERQPSNLLSLMRHEYRRISLGPVWESCGVKSLLVSNYAGFRDHVVAAELSGPHITVVVDCTSPKQAFRQLPYRGKYQ
jgi:hypothetical protein